MLTLLYAELSLANRKSGIFHPSSIKCPSICLKLNLSMFLSAFLKPSINKDTIWIGDHEDLKPNFQDGGSMLFFLPIILVSLSWKGHTRIIDSKSWIHKGWPKIQILYLRSLSKFSLNPSRLDVMTQWSHTPTPDHPQVKILFLQSSQPHPHLTHLHAVPSGPWDALQ